MNVPIEEIVEDLNLDSVSDLDAYMAGYTSFYISKHRVTLGVNKDGSTGFTVDGACDFDFDNMKNPMIGALILRRLLKEWKKLAEKLEVIPFCYPCETDGLFNHRVKMFQLAGFQLVDNDGKMVYSK